MKKLYIILLLAVLSVNLTAKIFVFPFRVAPENKKEVRWLGKGASKYISLGLEENGFDTVDDEVLSQLLNRRNVTFPYTVSKATAIALAKNWNGRYLISGEVSCGSSEGEIQIRAWIIDLVNFKQYYSPLIKGRIDGIIDVQRELLRFMIHKIVPGREAGVRLNVLNLSNHAYELYVKASLISDKDKRLNFLRKIIKDFKGYEAFNFKIARELYNRKDYKGAATALKRINQKRLAGRTRFLKGLVLFALKSEDRGESLFRDLGKEWYNPCESANNAGVICFDAGKYSEAEDSFIKALKIRKSPEVYMNLVLSLTKQGKFEKARRFTSKALRLYPETDGLVDFFQYFLTVSGEKYKDAIMDVFQEKISEFHPEQKVPVTRASLMNPFSVSSYADMKGVYRAEDESANGNADVDEELEKYGNMLEANPFVDEYYRYSGMLYSKKKQFYKAETYIRTAIWLNPTVENYFALLDIFKKTDKDYEAEELKNKIRRDFGSSEDIVNRLKKY